MRSNLVVKNEVYGAQMENLKGVNPVDEILTVSMPCDLAYFGSLACDTGQLPAGPDSLTPSLSPSPPGLQRRPSAPPSVVDRSPI